MSRTLPTGFAALATGKVFRPVFFVFLDWPGDPVYAWNGYGNYSWDSHTWVGTGHLGNLSQISESKDLAANGLVLTLSGIPSDLIAKALADDTMGCAGKVWISSLSAAGVLEADPLQIFDGEIDICPGEDDGKTATISVQLEKDMIDRRIKDRRRTHEDQQIDAPGDLIFEYVAALSQNPITFGPSRASAGLPAGAYYPTAAGLQRFE